MRGRGPGAAGRIFLNSRTKLTFCRGPSSIWPAWFPRRINSWRHSGAGTRKSAQPSANSRRESSQTGAARRDLVAPFFAISSRRNHSGRHTGSGSNPTRSSPHRSLVVASAQSDAMRRASWAPMIASKNVVHCIAQPASRMTRIVATTAVRARCWKRHTGSRDGLGAGRGTSTIRFIRSRILAASRSPIVSSKAVCARRHAASAEASVLCPCFVTLTMRSRRSFSPTEISTKLSRTSGLRLYPVVARSVDISLASCHGHRPRGHEITQRTAEFEAGRDRQP